MNSADFPTGVPINLIFGVSWSSSDTASMDIVYKVTVSEPIEALLTASMMIVDSDKSVTLDGRSTVFKETNSTNGLTYAWQCPSAFQSYCDEWLGSPVMELPPTVFNMAQGKLKTPYTFTMRAWSLQAGTDPDPLQVFSAKTTLKWTLADTPEFGLVVTTAPDPANPVLFTTQTNQI